MTTTARSRTLTHLQRLEAESIHIMRETASEAENPVMLYSIGKDSSVMLRLALKAFRMPVQWVNRPNLDFRGFSGLVSSGTLRPGDRVRVCPSGKCSTVKSLVA
jgi:hypothetical protein